MALNPVSVGARTRPMSNQLTAGGGYTTPQHAFIPHPTTQAFNGGGGPSGQVAAPQTRMTSGTASPNAHARNLPAANQRQLPATVGTRVFGIVGGTR